MRQTNWLQIIQENLANTLDLIDTADIDKLAENILKSERVFLSGKGRTGLVTEMFAMRLTQLGFQVHLLDQPTTPALTREDLLILFSGSGETNGILSAADKAKEIEAEITVVTREKSSSLAQKTADHLIIPIKASRDDQFTNSKVFSGTLFEQALLTILDLVIVQLVELTGQSFQDMDRRHANME
jgi:6-phospho-3-hexuloisomerase